jgi:GntR family transcriptional regulator
VTIAPLDRQSPLPLWAQLLADLRRRVAAGEFAEGFPTDEELRRVYQVSRQTVREAARRLQAEGVIVRQRGRGSALAGSVLEQPLQALYSLARTAEDLGLVEHSEVLALHQEQAGACAEPLGVGAGTDVVYVERLRFVGDEPLSLHRSWFPAALAQGLLGCDLSTGSLYDALVSACGVRVTGGWERIRPGIPSPELRRRLKVPKAGAVFETERLAIAGTVPAEWRQSVIRGDRYSLRADWSAI